MLDLARTRDSSALPSDSRPQGDLFDKDQINRIACQRKLALFTATHTPIDTSV